MNILILDLETTGFDPAEHMPVEIGGCELATAGFDLLGHPDDWSAIEPLGSMLLDPGRLLPPEASAVHHLVGEDLAGAMPWRDGVRSFIKPAFIEPGRSRVAYAAHKAEFERQWLDPLLPGGVSWICTWKCALRAWPDAPSHSNQALRYWLAPAGLDRARAQPAHRAGPDAYVTAFLLRELLALHRPAELIGWSEEPALLVRVPFGKLPKDGGWRGCRWSEVDDGFLAWVASRDFAADVRHTVEIEIERRQNQRAA